MSRNLSLPILSSAADAAAWLRQHTAILCTDSRKVQAGHGFVAWPGAAHDARAHVLGALQQGASACLVEAEGVEVFDFMQPQHQALVQGRVACVPGLRRLTGQMADLFYGEPSSQLDIVAATGTNGKTSTSWWLAQALARVPAGADGCALVGTLGVGRFVQNRAELEYTGMTTPDPVLLQRRFRGFVDAGVRSCAIEAEMVSNPRCSATSRKAPFSVSSTPRCWRMNSAQPRSASSALIWWLTAAGVTLISPAASLKLRCRAAASKEISAVIEDRS